MAKRILIGAVAAVLAGLATGAAASAAPLARIAFSGGAGIQVLRADGSEPATLLKGDVGEPAWSPDGTMLAYTRVVLSTNSDERAQIWVMRSDGSGQRPVTPAPGRAIEEGFPAWSPDGREIVFIRNRFSENKLVTSLVVSAADGGQERTLLSETQRTLSFLGFAAWSPDGNRILFTKTSLDKHAYFRPSLYSIPAAGGGSSLLLGGASSPSFSPDGGQIAFVSIRDHNGSRCGEDECDYAGEIYVMNSDGSNQRRLTSEKGDDENPAWSPDGQRIAFDSDRNYPGGESHELYSVRPDGSCLTWLTNGIASNQDPTWEPGPGLSTDPGGCGAVSRPPLTGPPPPARGPRSIPLFWLGANGPGSLLPSLVQVDRHFAEIDYDDCSLFDPKGCGDSIGLEETSVCTDDTLRFLDHVHPFAVRGTLATADELDPEQKNYEIFAGATTIDLSTSTRARFAEIVALLRPVGADAPAQTLPPPELPDRVWRALNRVVSAKRRLHSIRAVARALNIGPVRVRERLRLVALLDSLGPRRVVHCRVKR